MPHALHSGELLCQRIIIDLSHELSLDKLSEILGRIGVPRMVFLRLRISMARVSLPLLVVVVVRVGETTETCDGIGKHRDGLLGLSGGGLERGFYGFGDKVSHGGCQSGVNEKTANESGNDQ